MTAPVTVPATEDEDSYTEDQEFALPFASTGAENVSGLAIRNASMGGEEEQLKLGFIMLEACDVDEETLAAFYSLPATSMLEHLETWMRHGDGDGASVPQS